MDKKSSISGIYRWVNIVDNKTYVGSSKDIYARRKGHTHSLNSGRHHSWRFQRAWNKNGDKAFEFEVIEECSVDLLMSREQFWIDFYRSSEPEFGYNIWPTAGSARGYKQTKEHRDRVSQAVKSHWEDPVKRAARLEELKKVWADPEYRNRQSQITKEALKNSEYRKKISEARRGTKFSEETKKKLSESHKGIKRTEESKRKGSEKTKALWSGPWGEEQRKKRRLKSKKQSAVKKGPQEVRRGISESLKKFWRSERGLRMKESKKPVSEETKKKLSESLKGRTLSDSTKVAMKLFWASEKGRKVIEERIKRRAAKN